MRIIIIGDLHITEKTIPELKEILEEIFQYKADKIIQLGDFYDNNRPTPKELEFGTEVINRMKKLYKDVTILSGTGKHDILNAVSIVEYLQHFEVNVPGIIYETEIDGLKCLFGHFMTNKSLLEYGTSSFIVTELEKKYDLVILGHQHLLQKISDKIYHLGSVLYQHFNEVNDKYKQIAIIENGKLNLITLKNPIPMIEIITGECQNYVEKQLEKISSKTKVRIVYPNFVLFKKDINNFTKWKKKYYEFKIKLDFQNTQLITSEKENKNLQVLVNEWVKKIEDKEVREELEAEFKEEGLL